MQVGRSINFGQRVIGSLFEKVLEEGGYIRLSFITPWLGLGLGLGYEERSGLLNSRVVAFSNKLADDL